MELEMEFCIVLEQTVLMVPQTCLLVDSKPVYQLSKLDLTDKQTDICNSRTAFAAENAAKTYVQQCITRKQNAALLLLLQQLKEDIERGIDVDNS